VRWLNHVASDIAGAIAEDLVVKAKDEIKQKDSPRTTRPSHFTLATRAIHYNAPAFLDQ
jgi:hypothetical protein